MKHIKYILVTIILIISYSCIENKTRPESKHESTVEEDPIEIDEPLDFNLIEHYSKIQSEELDNSVRNTRHENQTNLQKRYIRVLNENYPDKVNDTTFFNFLKSKNSKNVISQKGILEFKKLFDKHRWSKYATKACIPYYNDIYVLKKDTVVTGVAKICYQCEIIYFAGRTTNWERFGDSSKELELMKSIK